MPKRKGGQPRASKRTKKAPARLELAAVQKRTIGVKKNPQSYTFARITFSLKTTQECTIEANEFEFILASAVQAIHGDIANKPDILKFEVVDSQHYRALIRFQTVHYTRIITSLILFGHWKEAECKFELDQLAQTPCFLIQS